MELIHDYFAGELTESQYQQLQAWLEEDPSHVDQLVREAFVHRQITDAMASRKALGVPLPGLPILCEGEDAFGKSSGTAPGSSAFSVWSGVLPKLSVLLCVVLVAATAVFVSLNKNHDAPVAPSNNVAETNLQTGRGCPLNSPSCNRSDVDTVASVQPLGPCTWQYQKMQQPLTDSRVEAGQTLNLLDGKARVSFDCGAVLTLTGPTVLQVDSNMDATLIDGNVAAVVSHEAIGFLLHTTKMDVRDLGTEFNVRVDPQNGTEVQVVDGEVEAELSQEPGEKQVVNLIQGQYLRAGNEPTSAPDRLNVFRGARIDFDKPKCLELFKIQNPDYDHIHLDRKAGKLILDTTRGSVYARDEVGKNLFLLPVVNSVDFDVVLTVHHFEPMPISDHVGVICMADKDNFVRVIYGAGQQRYVKFTLEEAGTPLQEFEEPVEFGDKPFKLRLTRRGGEISAWWSNDNGEHWIFRDKAKSPPNASYVGFYVSKGHTKPSDAANFRQASIESFEVECGE